MPRLRPLSDHPNVRFSESSYDVRSWKVRTVVDDQEVGEVHDVLVDDNARTRYLDVDLEGGRHVLVPSGDTSVDPENEVVRVQGLDRDGIGTLPDYDHRPETVTPEYSRSVTERYDSAFVDSHHYDRADYRSWAADSTPAGTDRPRTGEVGRLDRLDDVDVASHDPDPRGWEVVGSDGRRIGEVDHIIGDTGAMKARYLTVDLDSELAENRQVLLPVGHVDLDTDRKRVVSRALHRERAGEIPAYEGGTIDRDYENELMTLYNRAYHDDRVYEHPRYRSPTLDTRELGDRR